MVPDPSALYRAIRSDIEVYSLREQGPSLLRDYLDGKPVELSSYARRTTVACKSLLDSIVKKFEPIEPDETLGDKAKAKFLEMNRRCLDWSPPEPGSFSYQVLNRMRGLIHTEFWDLFPDIPEWPDLLSNAAPGPGSSVGSRGRNTALEKFFMNPCTLTDAALYFQYSAFMSQNSNWIAAENLRVLQNGSNYQLVTGSKLSTVRKNSDIDRTICTEPSLNMLFQKALSVVFERLLLVYYGYKPDVQPDLNGFLAWAGSIDGEISTIDLTSASDLNSLKMLEWLLPDWVFAALLDCRSPVTSIDGSTVTLHMMSSMGNGFTFSLMTYVFSVMLKAVAIECQFDFERFSCEHTRYGVFGDDIVIPTELYTPVVWTLQALGHVPNLEKSYSTGYFRESCGTDCYKGYNVRGVYCKRLRHSADVHSLINRLNRWSARHSIPLVATMALLHQYADPKCLVPSYEADTAGIKVPYSLKPNPGPRYTRLEPVKKVLPLYTRKGKVTRLNSNPTGLWLIASLGWVQSAGLVRRRDAVYRRAVSYSPGWDNENDHAEYDLTFREWRDAVYINFSGLI